jgi:multicomponent Na+:H+ antiporter subunit D
MEQALPALVIVVPLITACLIAVVGRYARSLSWPLTVLATAFSFVGAIRLLIRAVGGETVIYSFGGWLAPTGIEYRVDLLNGIVLTMVATVGFLVALWMRLSTRQEIQARAHYGYYAVLLLFLTGLMGITITGDVFNLYVFLEISSISSYLLVAMGKTRQSLYAGLTYLILGSIGATFVLLGIGHLYMATGSLQMTDIAQILYQPVSEGGPLTIERYESVVETAFAFIAVGLAVKMALFPLHSWQPGAYTFAPSGVSFVMAATSTKVAAYAFYRFSFTVFGVGYLEGEVPAVLDALLIMAATAMVIGPLLAVRQDNLKRMLAYSSVGQIAYVILGALLLNRLAIQGSLVHFWNHAASKGALFGVAGALVFVTGSARIDDLRGLARRAPWTAVAMTLAAFSLVGVPLTGGFITKYYLSVGALEAGRGILLPFILVSSVLTAIYMWRCLQRVWFAPADVEPAMTREVPWSMRLPTMVLALAGIVFGIWAALPMGIAAKAAEILVP